MKTVPATAPRLSFPCLFVVGHALRRRAPPPVVASLQLLDSLRQELRTVQSRMLSLAGRANGLLGKVWDGMAQEIMPGDKLAARGQLMLNQVRFTGVLLLRTHSGALAVGIL